MKFKNEMRILGIDDSPFDKFKKPKSKVLVVGVIMRGGVSIDGVLSTKVAIDGRDSTKKIIEIVNKCKFKPQLQCIFLNGIAVAGFNVIDIKKLNEETKIPVVVVIRTNPNVNKIKNTLIKLKKQEKIKLIEKAGNVAKLNNVFVQLAGIKIGDAKRVLDIACTRSLVPEPLRLAHIIASGIVSGESKGKA